MTDIDALIDKQHAQAQRDEEDARAIIARLHSVPGISAWLSTAQKRRRNGQEPNPWREDNLSARALIQKHDPALASFLAGRAGKAVAAPDYDRIAAEERRAAQATKLAEETRRLRETREAQQRQRNFRFTHGTYSPIAGKVV